MFPRSLLACFLVAAVLAAPPAMAIGDELFGIMDEVEGVLPTPPLPITMPVDVEEDILAPTGVTPTSPSEQEEAEASADAPTDAPPADEDEAAPEDFFAVHRLVPIPLVDAEPLRLDLVRLVDDVAPWNSLAPTQPARGAAPAPVQHEPMTAASAQAPEPVGPAAVLPPAAVVAAVAAATGAAPVASFGWHRLRRLWSLAFFGALYTRIGKDKLLDHEARETLLTFVRANPGRSLVEVAERAGIPRNTATYHLRRLEREGFVSSARQGRTRHYFAAGSGVRRDQADAFAALRHETSRAIACAIGASPGLDQQTLCARFGLAPSLAHWHADRLVEAGVVKKEREGRHVRYYPGAAYEDLLKNGNLVRGW